MEEKPRITPYPLRMPDKLRAHLEASAKSSARSLQAEIIARLQASFQRTVNAEDAAIARGDGLLSPGQMKLVQEAATAAAERVFLMAQGFNTLELGTPSIAQVQPSESANPDSDATQNPTK